MNAVTLRPDTLVEKEYHKGFFYAKDAKENWYRCDKRATHARYQVTNPNIITELETRMATTPKPICNITK